MRFDSHIHDNEMAYLLHFSTAEDRCDVMMFVRCFRDKLRPDKRYGTSEPVCSSFAVRVKRFAHYTMAE